MYDESKQKLYQVMQESSSVDINVMLEFVIADIQAGIGTDDYRVEQLEADAVNLNTKFVYLLISITVELTWIWRGAGAREEEVAEAARVARLMSPYTMAMVREGEEPIEFWTVLGGQDPYANDELDDKYRLVAIETGSDGAIEAVEVFDFEQSNLSDRRVAILDAGDTVYIWVGSRSGQEGESNNYLLLCHMCTRFIFLLF